MLPVENKSTITVTDKNVHFSSFIYILRIHKGWCKKHMKQDIDGL